MSFARDMIEFLLLFVALVIAIVLHEVAHGLVAYWRGDDTAKVMGRLTLNPIKHVDMFGSIMLPVGLKLLGSPFLLGYAKPVPVDFNRLYRPKLDMVLVAIAGPVTNILLAFIFVVLLLTFSSPEEMFTGNKLFLDIIIFSIQINVLLAVFNMIPVLPLDGGRVLSGLLPSFLADRYSRLEPYGMFILLGLIFFVPSVTELLTGYRLTIFGVVIQPIAKHVIGSLVFFANMFV